MFETLACSVVYYRWLVHKLQWHTVAIYTTSYTNKRLFVIVTLLASYMICVTLNCIVNQHMEYGVVDGLNIFICIVFFNTIFQFK